MALSIAVILILTSNHAVIQHLIYSKKVFYGITFFAIVMVIWTLSELLHETPFYLWLRLLDSVLITILIIYGLLWIWRVMDNPTITLNRDFREIVLSLVVFWMFWEEIKNYVSTEVIQPLTVTLDLLAIPLSMFLLVFAFMYLNELLKGSIAVPVDTVPFFLGSLVSFVLLNFSLMNYVMENHFEHYVFDFGAITVFLYCEIKYIRHLYTFSTSEIVYED